MTTRPNEWYVFRYHGQEIEIEHCDLSWVIEDMAKAATFVPSLTKRIEAIEGRLRHLDSAVSLLRRESAKK